MIVQSVLQIVPLLLQEILTLVASCRFIRQSAQPTSAGTYTLTVTNTANGCTATDAVTVSQNITPPTANAGPNITLTCTNPSLQIMLGNTYSWSPPAGLSVNNIAQPTANAPGTYTLTVTNTANGCTATSSVTVSQYYHDANAGPILH
ncbi:MAG: hypothetical protein U0T69_09575 [Chitinophagales bacterium]